MQHGLFKHQTGAGSAPFHSGQTVIVCTSGLDGSDLKIVSISK